MFIDGIHFPVHWSLDRNRRCHKTKPFYRPLWLAQHNKNDVSISLFSSASPNISLPALKKGAIPLPVKPGDVLNRRYAVCLRYFLLPRPYRKQNLLKTCTNFNALANSVILETRLSEEVLQAAAFPYLKCILLL